MYFYVVSKIICLRQCIITLCTLVWHLSTLHELVRFQVSSFTKRISALCTFVYFLPSVGDHGSSKYLLDQITFHILSKYVPLFHCGRARVFFKISNKTKGSLTLDTSMCPFFAVGDHVRLDQMTSYILSKCPSFFYFA